MMRRKKLRITFKSFLIKTLQQRAKTYFSGAKFFQNKKQKRFKN